MLSECDSEMIVFVSSCSRLKRTNLTAIDALYLYRLVLRIRADDPEALCQLGVKFGCSVPEGKALLNIARSLGLKVVGIR